MTDEANLQRFVTGLQNANIPPADTVKNQTLRRALQQLLGADNAAVMAINARNDGAAARTLGQASAVVDKSLVPAICAIDPSLSPPC